MRIRDDRYPCSFPVEVRLSNRVAMAVIENLSIGGALVTGLGSVRAGHVCTLVIEGELMPATVRWNDGVSAGVLFQRRISRRQFETVTGVELQTGARYSRTRSRGYAHFSDGNARSYCRSSRA